MPQKHPPASTTVCELLVLLSGSSDAGFGSFTAALEAWQAMVVLKHIAKKQFINRRNIHSPINSRLSFSTRHADSRALPFNSSSRRPLNELALSSASRTEGP